MSQQQPSEYPRIVERLREEFRGDMPTGRVYQSEPEAPKADAIFLNTKRDIRCYVITHSELSTIKMCDRLIMAIIAILVLQAIFCAVVMYNFSDMFYIAITATASTVPMCAVGAFLLRKWKASIIKSVTVIT